MDGNSSQLLPMVLYMPVSGIALCFFLSGLWVNICHLGSVGTQGKLWEGAQDSQALSHANLCLCLPVPCLTGVMSRHRHTGVMGPEVRKGVGLGVAHQ